MAISANSTLSYQQIVLVVFEELASRAYFLYLPAQLELCTELS